MQQFLKAIIALLISTPFAFGGIAPGSLSASLPIHNNTHYALQVGTTVSAQIVNATDLPPGTTTVPVWVKSSVLGNTLLVGSVSGTTISFTYTAPANGCQTTIVAYGSTGNNANNGIITPGGSSVAGFAFTNGNGIVQECYSNDCPENLEARGGTLTCSNLATVQLFASTGDPNSTYSWSGPGIVSGGNTATPLVNRVGTYTVTASTPNCPTLSTSVEVTAEPVECTTLVNSSCYSSSSEVCEGGSVTFSASGSGPGAPFTYSWSGPNGFSSTSASVTLSNVTLANAGEYVVTVTDANGFYSYCSSTVTVHSAPTLSGCPEDASYQCIADVPPPANVTAMDDQGSVTVEFSETQSNNGSNCNNVITRTWTATNSCGSVSCTQVINVNDTTAPTFTFVPEDKTIECPAEPVFGEAVASDACGSVTITFSDVTTPGECAGSYSVTRTWTATDACGNSATASATINVVDTEAPSFTVVPQGGTIECPATPVFGEASATDGCSDVIITYNDVTTQGDCAGSYSVTRTWTATDACGNSATASATINVVDTEAPSFTVVPQGGTIECPATPVFGEASATDGCSDVIITYNDVTTQGDCAGSYSVTRTWTATDACGNSATASATINVVDTEAPSFTVVPQGGTIECPATPVFGEASATDGCSDVIITYNDVTTQGDCAGSYSVTRTWTATDACGNSATASATINVVDTEAPSFTVVPQGGTIECPATPVFGEASATDGCSEVIITYNDVTTQGDCAGSYSVTRTWTATDACGNSTTASATINVEDHTAPSISCPENIVVSTNNNDCGAVVTFEISANDECSDVTVVATPPSGSTFSFGTTTVNVTATDACGNSSSCSFTVTVLSSISGMKFYDSNSNGVKDEGEVGIAGWKITLNGPDNLSMTQFTANDGNYSFNGLAPGSYTVCEVMPTNAGWSNITPLCQTIELTCNAVVNFGNIYSSTPGGHTIGFWQNKNGEKLVTSANLTALRGFCLRNANGTNFDPTSYNQFKTWLKGANATNMAYMLSAQMTATYLSVMHGFTNPSVLVDGNRNVTDLIAYANALLCANGYTPSGDSNRAEQTRVKDILDNINNGRSFVQPVPGPVIYPLGSTQQFSEVGSEEVNGSQRVVPKEYQLFGNYPNPFNPTTTFAYALPEDAFVTLKVYDILGREVATLVNGVQQAGYYNETFNASSLSSGVYIYRFSAGNFSAVKKFTLMK